MDNLCTSEKFFLNKDELYKKSQKLNLLKDILSIDNDCMNEYELELQVKNISESNFLNLIGINSMLKEMPAIVKNELEKLFSLYKNNKVAYTKKYSKIEIQFINNSQFQMYEGYIIQLLVSNILENLNGDLNEESLKHLYLEEKRLYFCLFYEIIKDFLCDFTEINT